MIRQFLIMVKIYREVLLYADTTPGNLVTDTGQFCGIGILHTP